MLDKKVEENTNKMMRNMGYKKTNWLGFTKVLMMILFVLNAFACYARPDFLTQIVCVLSVFYLTANENVNKTKFRVLPIAILISFIYDLIYLIFIQNLAQQGARVEGGMENGVKNFALKLSIITFFFKPVVFFVLWKVSYNYL